MNLQNKYFKVQDNGLSPFHTMSAYMGGSVFQTIMDNPITSYRQLVQQYAKDVNGNIVHPSFARREALNTFYKNPISASMSGIMPRIVGVGFKRIPKFGFLLGYSYITGQKGKVDMTTATFASIMSAPFINPIRMIEKQQRAFFRETGKEKPIIDIIRESSRHNFKPLFRGTIPLMAHSLASATTGLVGQPQLQKYIKKELGTKTNIGSFTAGLISSSVVSPIYVMMTNPLSRLEVIMQTNKIDGKDISMWKASKELIQDTRLHGLQGVFRGQGVGIVKAIISLTLFHEGRLFLTHWFQKRNKRLGYY